MLPIVIHMITEAGFRNISLFSEQFVSFSFGGDCFATAREGHGWPSVGESQDRERTDQ